MKKATILVNIYNDGKMELITRQFCRDVSELNTLMFDAVDKALVQIGKEEEKAWR